ncbi:hypothetical protein GA0115253_101495 [Streptomyces sp. Termitarium-T10T-6]|nr:hypothetical protein GA0115253_101495 [Streptomyces sp. Termitarium-T10T-6]
MAGGTIASLGVTAMASIRDGKIADATKWADGGDYQLGVGVLDTTRMMPAGAEGAQGSGLRSVGGDRSSPA